jgi:hypothetical protein
MKIANLLKYVQGAFSCNVSEGIVAEYIGMSIHTIL